MFFKSIAFTLLITSIVACASDSSLPGRKGSEGKPELKRERNHGASSDVVTDDEIKSDDLKQSQYSADESILKDAATPDPSSMPKGYGLYVFDGTGLKKSEQKIIAQFYNNAQSSIKKYFPGPNLLGSDTRSLIEAGKKRICEDWLSGKIDKVFLVGYSRGAMISVAISGELTREDLSSIPEKRFCGNSGVDQSLLAAVPPEKLKPKFVWLGLLDAVDTLNYDLLDTVEGTGADCFHLAKKNEWEAVLTTKQIRGCQKSHVQGSTKIAFISKPLSHTDLSSSKEALQKMTDEAKKYGVAFQSL